MVEEGTTRAPAGRVYGVHIGAREVVVVGFRHIVLFVVYF